MKVLFSGITAFSQGFGVLTPGELCTAAGELGYSGVALCDRGSCAGVPEFFNSCMEKGLSPVIGVDLALNPNKQSFQVYSQGSAGLGPLFRLLSLYNREPGFDTLRYLQRSGTGLCVLTDSLSAIDRIKGDLPVYYRIRSLRRLPSEVRNGEVRGVVAPDAAFRDTRDIERSNLLKTIKLKKNWTQPLPELSAALIPSPRDLYERFSIYRDSFEQGSLLWPSLSIHGFKRERVMPVKQGAGRELRNRVYSGIYQRLERVDAQVRERIERELEIIDRKGYSAYFLIAQGIASMGSRVCGRGSSAGSCVAWALGITDVNPIDYGLIFERFLNEEREDPPDIDIDFPWDEREGILRDIFMKYKGRVGMAAAFQHFEFRGAVREIARSYGFSDREISEVTQCIPMGMVESEEILGALHSDPGLGMLLGSGRWKKVFTSAMSISGILKTIGCHCGGIVITPYEINRYAPVTTSSSLRPLIQWDKHGIEDMGLVKMDILGNRSLSVIRDAFGYLYKDQGFTEKDCSFYRDSGVEEMVAQGDTAGIFYIESPAMRQVQKKTGLGDPRSLTVHTSLIRPAANKYTADYIARGYGTSEYRGPRLFRDLFRESRGVMVFQEDIIRLAYALSMSASEGERLRRAVSKGHHTDIQELREKFYKGACARSIPEHETDEMWRACTSFKGYSFCKAHSASYVGISLKSAWLKRYHPGYFFAAVMDNRGGYYPVQFYVSEAKRKGCRVRPPDINRSELHTRVKHKEVITGFNHIKGIGSEAVKRILDSRKGGFNNFHNLLNRSGIERGSAEILIRSGACDRLGPRENLLLELASLKGTCGTGVGHGGGGAGAAERSGVKSLMYLRQEYSCLGFITEFHPVELVHRGDQCIRISEIGDWIGREVSVTGYCCAVRSHITQGGRPMVFMTLDDETGVCETLLFSDLLSRAGIRPRTGRIYRVLGTPESEYGAVSLNLREITAIKPGYNACSR